MCAERDLFQDGRFQPRKFNFSRKKHAIPQKCIIIYPYALLLNPSLAFKNRNHASDLLFFLLFLCRRFQKKSHSMRFHMTKTIFASVHRKNIFFFSKIVLFPSTKAALLRNLATFSAFACTPASPPPHSPFPWSKKGRGFLARLCRIQKKGGRSSSIHSPPSKPLQPLWSSSSSSSSSAS